MIPQFTSNRQELIACLEAGELSHEQTAELVAMVQGQRSGCQPIETAPKDGKSILLWIGHPNARFSADPIQDGWAGWCRGRWSDFNGGGWTWDGFVGTPTHWQPLPPPPGEEPTSEEMSEVAPVVPSFLIGLSPEKCNEIADRITDLTPEEMKWAVAERKKPESPAPEPDALAELERWLSVDGHSAQIWEKYVVLTVDPGRYRRKIVRSGSGKTFLEAFGSALAALGKAGKP